MFDPTHCLVIRERFYVICHTGRDYVRGTPKRVLWNPLRWEIGIGKSRPCLILINQNGRARIAVSNAVYRFKKVFQ